MEKIRNIVERVLNKKERGAEEGDYLALWEEVVPREIRRHSRVRLREGKLVVLVDNPTTGHLLFLRRAEIAREFRANNLAMKDLVIRQSNRG